MPAAASAAATTRGRCPRPARRSGFGRIAGISASLVGTQALTSVLGLVFWALAARAFLTGEVGVAGAAVATMMLSGSRRVARARNGAHRPAAPTVEADRRVLVRTCTRRGGAAGTLPRPRRAGTRGAASAPRNLAPIAGSIWPLLGLAAGTGLTSVVIVLDQAVLTIGLGTLQLERNVAASGVKVVALLAFGLAGMHGGMTILLAWTIGNLLSLPLVSWRTRGGRSTWWAARTCRAAKLRGTGGWLRLHHALNVSIQAALQVLPYS